MTFFLSRDPLSPAYEERSVSLRTEQAFVEHHLFVLLPTWLEAVKEEEWERLQAALRGGGGDDDEVSAGRFFPFPESCAVLTTRSFPPPATAAETCSVYTRHGRYRRYAESRTRSSAADVSRKASSVHQGAFQTTDLVSNEIAKDALLIFLQGLSSLFRLAV